MTSFRSFRNGDVPVLTDLWNRALPELGVARPLEPHEFDAAVLCRLFFEADGLIVAEQGDSIVGFCHAGFGPIAPDGPSHRLDMRVGTVAMLAVAPEVEDVEIDDTLMVRAIDYLRDRGAEVIYAGGRAPLNPFYWGVYGGSEFSGILERHDRFQRAADRLGFRRIARSVLMEASPRQLAQAPRDPRTIHLRRRTQIEKIDDALLDRWWDALAIGPTMPNVYRVLDSSGQTLARATSWEMAGFDRIDGRIRTGLVDVEVAPSHRRQGVGRYLLGEVVRALQGRMVDTVCVQTDESNEPALAFYRSLGFEVVDHASLYRR